MAKGVAGTVASAQVYLPHLIQVFLNTFIKSKSVILGNFALC